MTGPDGIDWLGDGTFSGPSLTPQGTLRVLDTDAALRQSLLLLLATRPGERLMRPLYGCDIHRLVFAPNDATTGGLAIHYVRRAIEQWEPRVELLAVDAGPFDARRHQGVWGAGPETLVIEIAYRARTTGRTFTLLYPLPLEGAANAP